MHQQALTFSLDGMHTPCLKRERTTRLGVQDIKYDLLLPLHECWAAQRVEPKKYSPALPLAPRPPHEASLPIGIPEPGVTRV